MDEQLERRAFHDWCVKEGHCESKSRLRRLNQDGIGYDDRNIDAMWMGWCARADFCAGAGNE
jgi:hypothetical protein